MSSLRTGFLSRCADLKVEGGMLEITVSPRVDISPVHGEVGDTHHRAGRERLVHHPHPGGQSPHLLGLSQPARLAWKGLMLRGQKGLKSRVSAL